MVITKQRGIRLGRVCNRCSIRFVPETRMQYICDDCFFIIKRTKTKVGSKYSKTMSPKVWSQIVKLRALNNKN